MNGATSESELDGSTAREKWGKHNIEACEQDGAKAKAEVKEPGSLRNHRPRPGALGKNVSSQFPSASSGDGVWAANHQQTMAWHASFVR